MATTSQLGAVPQSRLIAHTAVVLATLLCVSLHADAATDTVTAAQARKARDKSAPCTDPMLDVLGRFLHIAYLRPVRDDGQVVASACKRWAARPGFVLASILYRPQSGADFRQVVAVIDGATSRVVSSWQEDSVDSAGLEHASLSIDTARYDLAPGIRAFGVDLLNPYMPPLAEGGSGSERTLFVLAGARLKPVVERLTMSQWRYVVGPGIEEKSESETFPVALTVASSASHGYADLRVDAIALDDAGRRKSRTPFVYTLHYDGKQYRTDQLNEAFWAWQK